MAFCAPSCALPSCASAPILGLGSPYSLGCGHGFGYSSLGYGSPGYSYGTSASSLGIVPGITPSCVCQLPSSEVVIHPAPCMVTVPGPILSASSEPVVVGGHSACAAGGYGFGGYGLSRYQLGGYGRRLRGAGYHGHRCIPIRRRYYRYPC